MAQYKSDKVAFEHAFLPFQLGIVAIEGISSQNSIFAEKAKDAFKKACEGKDTIKIVRRCHRISHDILLPMRDKSNDKISGHKFIIMLYALAQEILNSGYILPDYVIESFEPFLELELNQEMPDEDWINIKKSGEKIAYKIYNKLTELGYYESN